MKTARGGAAEVRETFNVPRVGTIAGCMVTSGEISRSDKVRVVRDGVVVYEGNIGSLRRFNDDVKSVKSGFECGIGIDGFQGHPPWRRDRGVQDDRDCA